MNKPPNLRKIIILATIFVIGCIIAWFAYDALTFRLKSTTPQNGSEVSSELPRVEFSFNKKLKDDKLTDRIVLLVDGENPSRLIRESMTVQDNKVIIELTNLDIDTEYEFTITDISAENGKKIDKVTLKFRTKFVPFDRLSKDDQQAAINEVEDPDTEQDPMYALTPYSTQDYSIAYNELMVNEENPGGVTPGDQRIITIHIVLSNADYRSDVNKIIKARKQQALNYLAGQGINVKDYTVQYTQDPYLGARP